MKVCKCENSSSVCENWGVSAWRETNSVQNQRKKSCLSLKTFGSFDMYIISARPGYTSTARVCLCVVFLWHQGWRVNALFVCSFPAPLPWLLPLSMVNVSAPFGVSIYKHVQFLRFYWNNRPCSEYNSNKQQTHFHYTDWVSHKNPALTEPSQRC